MMALNRSVSGFATTRSQGLLWVFLITAGGVLAADARAEPGLKTDPLLEQRIERRIAWDRELAPFRIAVEANDAVINLIGTVSTIA